MSEKSSFRTYAFILWGLILFNSCKSYQEVGYFKNIDDIISQQQLDSMDYRFRIEPDFILSIFVSAQNPASVVPFNQPLNSVFEPGQAQVKQNQTVQTYTVDQQGYINFPVLGKVKVAGLTKNECANLLETLISRYVDNPIVNV